MALRDWDCKKDGHIEVSKLIPNAGRGPTKIKVTWCAVCGKKL